jgi:hypothetical protein
VSLGQWRAILGVAAITAFSASIWPGETYLQSDTQIYVPVMEWLDDPSLYPGDQLPRGAHVSLTIYDEVTRGLRRLTGGLESALRLQQWLFRACGVAGIYLIARSAGATIWPALLAAWLASLGAWVMGPAVLTIEYEPIPRGFALGLLLLATGLLARGRPAWAGLAAAIAFLYHAPAVWPFWLIVLLLPERKTMLPFLGGAAILLAVLAPMQGSLAEPQRLFAILETDHAALQQMRASYNWVSLWWARHWPYYLAAALIAYAALTRLRDALPASVRGILLGTAAQGLATMPVSWLLLEQMRWALLPQLQPMRALLFTVLAAVVGASILAVRAANWPSRILWVLVPIGFTFAYNGHRPPKMETAELRELSDWARRSTGKERVFLFPEEGRGLAPGIFRARSLRSVYTDWKAGGQVNYFPIYAREWQRRWNATLAQPYAPERLPAYARLGIHYLVMSRTPIKGRQPVFENSRYRVYEISKLAATPEAASSSGDAPTATDPDTRE